MNKKLIEAVNGNNLEKVKEILNNNPDLNYTYPMVIACEEGYLDIVKCLNKGKRVKRFSILTAIECGQVNIVKYLLKNVSEDLENILEEAFVHAIEYNQLEILKHLVKKYKFDIHISDDYGLCLAARSGYFKMVQYFIRHDSDIHAQNEFPIRIALEYKHFDIVKYLVNKLI